MGKSEHTGFGPSKKQLPPEFYIKDWEEGEVTIDNLPNYLVWLIACRFAKLRPLGPSSKLQGLEYYTNLGEMGAKIVNSIIGMNSLDSQNGIEELEVTAEGFYQVKDIFNFLLESLTEASKHPPQSICQQTD